MKIFLDTACHDTIRHYADTNMIDGVTTNPSLMAHYAKKTGMTTDAIVNTLAELSNQYPVSVELTGHTIEDMKEQAKKWLDIGPQFVIKLPITHTGLAMCRWLTGANVRVNMTLCFSVNQAILAAKAGATYVSPFVGRLDDAGHNGIDLVANIAHVYAQHNTCTEILAASLRHPLHVQNAFLAGAHIVTIVPSLLDKMMDHPMTSAGIALCDKDWSTVCPNTRATDTYVE